MSEENPQPEASTEGVVSRLEAAGMLDHDPADLTIADREYMTQEQRDMLDDAQRNAVGWNPEVEPEIVGEVVDISEGESEYGTYPLVTIKTASGRDVSIHCFHTILKRDIQRRIDNNGLKVGDMLAVVYKGRGVATGGRNAPALYNVRVRIAKS